MAAQPALSEQFDDRLVGTYYKAFKGKKVAFVPISMGFDFTQAWMAAVQRDAHRLGYQVTIRDSNWNVDAGAQALEQLIEEKPDILIFQNNDMNAYAKLVSRAMAKGINVIQMNLKTPVNSDAFIGPDWYQVGVDLIGETAKLCGKGTSGKIGILTGPATSPPNMIGRAGEDAHSPSTRNSRSWPRRPPTGMLRRRMRSPVRS